MRKLTREEHLEMADCLRNAKRELMYVHYVCHAVGATYATQRTKKLVTEWIQKQLKINGHAPGTIISWLHYAGHGELALDIDRYEYRLAWIDHMIKILES